MQTSKERDFYNDLCIKQLIEQFVIFVVKDSNFSEPAQVLSAIDQNKYELYNQDLEFIRRFIIINLEPTIDEEHMLVDPERIAYAISLLKCNQETCRKLYHLTFSSWPEEDLDQFLNRYEFE